MSENSNFKSGLMKNDIHTKDEYYKIAFSRNIGLLTVLEQKKLKDSRVAIPGMGGVGGIHLITMVRSGIGNFNISDFDIFEPVNTNRQYGANTSSYGRSKLDVMKEQALLINPYININTFSEGINSDNMDGFLKDVDVVIDGLDFFNFDLRRLLFKKARQKGVYVITAGPMGFSSALLIFAPDRGMGFDEYFNIVDNMQPEDKFLSFALGLAPRPTHVQYMDFSKVDFEKMAGPSLNVACQLCAGMAGTEALRIILNRKGLKPVPYYFQFDPYLMKLSKGKLYFGNRNPVQRIKMSIVKRLLEAGKGVQKQSPPPLPKVFYPGRDTLPDDVKYFLLKAGIQAPSGDNSQPWKFSISENKIFVFLDPDVDRSFFNVNQIASMISCGAVIENIRIASGQIGFQPDIEYFSDETGVGGSIALHPGQAQNDPLYECIWKRHTNRTMYRQENISGDVLRNCREAISCFPETRLHVVARKDGLKKLAGIIYQIDRIRTEHRPLHEHLNKMIRFSSREINESNDGLPLKNLQAGFAGEQFLKFTKPWQVMNFLNKTGIGRLVAMHSYLGIINSSAVMLLTVGGMTDKDFLAGGRALQRVWLELTRHGYHVQPMTAATLFFMRFAFKKEHEFLPKHIRLLDSVKKYYLNLFPGFNLSNGQVMLFRVGFGREIKHFTKRKNVKDFLRQV
ncbi:ThiF family adenylyltransferase [Desulfobacula phenolica]|uniref:Molybdopterin or thiamine biosynthesis adenylyltransferase n=1 Tax=Desulfobacula phenolica TaxID=90732 RepID=A0A1H2EQ12_9BACT|nr:ThiF family adenylyltransferase [Desulfobacula phenolica]SDT97217.1 Molybdopterin or thiamine biosynthesis adenylyltransferase [Desulfobacula phenolica]